MRISKSKFLQYIQCPKRYWMSVHKPELADERDMTVFTNGTRIGEIARELFPGGVLLEYRTDRWLDLTRMLDETNEHMQAGTKIMYEAAFATNDLIAVCDIVVKTDDGYDIYEVKSSGSLKDVYFADAAFQYYVLKEAGVNVNRIFITHINTGYIRHGDIHLDEMFFHNDVTDHAKDTQKEIIEAIPDIINTYKMSDSPDIEIDLQCEKPYPCEYMGHCYSHIGNDSVFDLAGVQQKKKFSLYHSGLIYFDDLLNSDIELKKNIILQIEAAKSGQPIIDKEEINEFLQTLHYPLYFLDFETINPAVPLYEGTSPYQQIPTQYSLHSIEYEGGPLKHSEFLADENNDPREKMAASLAKNIPKDACVLAYHMSFEKKVISKLAHTYPEYSEKLMTIHQNVRDLIIPFRKRFYYTSSMHGKSSIKRVLPALFPDDPELSYESLSGVHNGSEASNAYLSLTDLPLNERNEIRKQLLEYCKLDTLAMVRIWEKLNEVISE